MLGPRRWRTRLWGVRPRSSAAGCTRSRVSRRRCPRACRRRPRSALVANGALPGDLWGPRTRRRPRSWSGHTARCCPPASTTDRALGSPADHEHDRVDLRHRPAADQEDQGRRQPERWPGHGLQAAGCGRKSAGDQSMPPHLVALIRAAATLVDGVLLEREDQWRGGMTVQGPINISERPLEPVCHASETRSLATASRMSRPDRPRLHPGAAGPASTAAAPAGSAHAVLADGSSCCRHTGTSRWRAGS